MNFGHSSRLGYDESAYNDRLNESVSPLSYRLNTHQISNCDRCLSVFGPRSEFGVSSGALNHVAPSQQLVDLESALSNRNVLLSNTKDGKVNNDLDVSNYSSEHANICNNVLDPVSSRLTNPTANYRGMSVNRFYDLPNNPQSNIFWNFETNTQLEARDNFVQNNPNVSDTDATLPVASDQTNCEYSCYSNCPDKCGCNNTGNHE